MNRWYEYVVEKTGTSNQTHIAAMTGIPQSTLSKWSRGQQPSIEQVQKFVRRVKGGMMTAFVLAGFFDLDDLVPLDEGDPFFDEVRASLESLSSHALMNELARRLEIVMTNGGERS